MRKKRSNSKSVTAKGDNFDALRALRDRLKTSGYLDIGDEIAKALRGKSLAENYKFAADRLGETETALRAKYAHLNPGQQRMCLGNRLRGAKRAEAEKPEKQHKLAAKR